MKPVLLFLLLTVNVCLSQSRENASVRNDTAFHKGSGIILSPINKSRNENLQLLGQVWGFLKYYHPRIASGKLNWDYELFRFLPDYLNIKTTGERDEKLLAWIKGLGEVPPCKSCKKAPGVKPYLMPPFTWFETGVKDTALRSALEYIRDNRNQGDHYYITMKPRVGNPVFEHESAYSEFVLPDQGFRLLALYRYWNMIEYFFPYRNVIGEDWNGVLYEFIPRVIDSNTPLQYRLTMQDLIGRINDTHAQLWPDTIMNNYKGRYLAPVQVKFIENKLVVTGYYDKKSAEATGLMPGDVITHIDNKSIDKIVEEKLPHYPASNYPVKLREIAKDILRGKSRQITLGIEKDHETFTKVIKLVRIDSIHNLNTTIDWAYNKPDSCYRLLQDDIGYIYLGNISSKLLPEIFEKFAKTKGIIIDIRNYPGDFVVFSLGKHLVQRSTDFVSFSQGSVDYPGMFTIRPGTKLRSGNVYTGKVVILVNEISQSNAEYTAMAFRAAPNATVVGSQTAGADGNVSQIVLPGNLVTAISGIGVYYPSGEETQRVGIRPDIEVKPTIKGIKEGRDEQLERAIEVIRK